MTNMRSAASYISLEYFIHRKPWRKHKGGGDKNGKTLSPLRFSSMIIFHKKKIESFSVSKDFTNFYKLNP